MKNAFDIFEFLYFAKRHFNGIMLRGDFNALLKTATKTPLTLLIPTSKNEKRHFIVSQPLQFLFVPIAVSSCALHVLLGRFLVEQGFELTAPLAPEAQHGVHRQVAHADEAKVGDEVVAKDGDDRAHVALVVLVPARVRRSTCGGGVTIRGEFRVIHLAGQLKAGQD